MSVIDVKQPVSGQAKPAVSVLDNIEIAPATPIECAEEGANRKWEEAIANTTEEEFDWLEKKFLEDEAKYGTMPLDFTGK